MRIFLFISLILCVGCSTSKRKLVIKNTSDDAIIRAIHDFVYTEKQAKKDSIFLISICDIDKSILKILISGDPNPYFVSTEDCKTYTYKGFPTRYYIHSNKLFYWNESDEYLNYDLIHILRKYGRIDTMVVNAYIPELCINDAQEGIVYLFCRNNLKTSKKIKVDAMGKKCKMPKLKCK